MSTSHPYVVRTAGVCGGRPHIRGTRVPVSAVAELVRRGEPADEIAATYRRVNPAAIQDAIGYYLDHRAEIEAELEEGSLPSALDQADAVLGDDGVIRFRDRTG